MRKRTILITAILAAVVLASCLILPACCGSDYATYEFVSDGDTDISIGVLADVHVMAEAQAVDMTCADFKSWEAHGQKMLGLSESILKTAVDRIIKESDFKVVLVSGDNADDGGKVSHRAVASELKRLENAGIKVFTIPGNHDINNHSFTYAGGHAARTNPTTEVEFAEIYADFGYDGTDVLEYYKNAGTSDLKRTDFDLGDNLSYVADISDKYRLIAIDMCNYVATYTDEDGYPAVNGRHDGAMTESLLLWAKSKAEEAVAAGKTPIGMMHFPLLQHFGPLVMAENGAVNDPEGYSVADVLADAGMRYIFTGHIHMQDDALYTSKKGNKILDVNSASLCNYPTPVRYFHAKGSSVHVRTWTMDYITESYLPTHLTADERKEITSDFVEYSARYIDGSMLAKLKNKVDIEFVYKLLKKFGVKPDGTNDSRVEALAQSIIDDVFLAFLNMPLYKSDAAKGQTSVESIVKSYGLKMPSSDYTSVLNLAMSYVIGVYGGDEQASGDETRATLLKYSVYSAVHMIAEFDLFTKLRAFNASIHTVDLRDSVSDLFKYGVLEVCSNGLLSGILGSLDISMLKKVGLNTSDPYSLLGSVKSLGNDLALLAGIDLSKHGIDLTELITVDRSDESGFIDLGAVFDNHLYGSVTLGLLNDACGENSTYAYKLGQTDNAVPDNNLAINTETMAYSALN